MTKKQLHLVIVTGMSGAGKTVAIQSFEDLGYFTIDNMPPALLPKFLQLVETKEDDHKLALVVDMRSRSFFSEIQAVLDELENKEELDFKILFLDAADKELVARYKETRRSHPLAADGRILDGIKLERELLAPLKNMSQNVVDTTELTPRELRKTIAEQFSDQEQAQSFRIEVMSFGFKYGIPIDADLVFDVRFLPNPYYLPELRNQTGVDEPVYDYVMNHPESEDFYQHRVEYQESQLPSNITIMSYSFYFSDSKVPYFILEIRKKLANAKVTININYQYFPENKTLEKNMWYFDGKTDIYAKEKIEDYLKQNGTSLDEVQSEFDRVLKEKILSDWTTIYPSRFTPTNWGEVDVKEYWEQRIVPKKVGISYYNP